MRKILLLTTLLTILGGASFVKAEKVQLRSTGFTEAVGGNCSYDEETKKFSWSAQYSNAVTVIKFTAGLLPYFSTVKLHVDDISEGGEFRIIVNSGTIQKWKSLSSTGDISINISEFQRWGTPITEEEIATAFEIRLSGSDGETHVGDWVKIDPTSIYLETSWDAPMSIASTSDWEGFSKFVSSGVTDLAATLTTDVNAGSTMVGTDTDGKRYSGTFEGNGHTLSFSYEGGGQFVAPFSCIDGATINDLLTTGTITTSNNMPGGIVGKNVGISTLTRCGSSMTLSTTDATNGRIGGLVGRCADGNQMTFNNCLYNGSISTAKSGYACGFVGWDNKAEKITLNNCLVAASSITGGGQNFINNTPIIPDGKYALFISKFGSSTQGTQVTDAQRYNGYVAYTLSRDISEGTLFFGQGYLNSSRVEDCPSLTSDASKKVYKEENNNYFANSGGLLPDPALLINKLAWKYYGGEMYPYEYKLSPEKAASGFELVGTSDAYLLNVTSACATTLVLPCDITTLPSGVKAYNLSISGSEIEATEVFSITANKPVLINAEPGEYKFTTSFDWSKTFDFASITETTNGALTGVYNTSLPFSYVPEGAYVLQNGPEGLCFYQVDAENPIKITSFRAYLTADAGDARALSIKFPDDETAINKVLDSSIKVQDSEIFNLAGQRMSKLQKGVNIVNGKKVLVK